jgi:hypothetical protein
LFQTDFFRIFFFSNRRKKKRKKRKKNIEKKKNAKKGGIFLQAPTLPSHFWLLLLPFCFKCFSWHFLLLKQKKITKNIWNKTIKKIKMHRKEGAFLQAPTMAFHFWLPLLFSPLLPFCFKGFLLASSSSQTEEKKRKP